MLRAVMSQQEAPPQARPRHSDKEHFHLHLLCGVKAMPIMSRQQCNDSHEEWHQSDQFLPISKASK